VYASRAPLLNDLGEVISILLHAVTGRVFSIFQHFIFPISMLLFGGRRSDKNRSYPFGQKAGVFDCEEPKSRRGNVQGTRSYMLMFGRMRNRMALFAARGAANGASTAQQ
jgi:hypothetical protein